MSAGDRLREMLSRARLSMAKAAKAIGYAGASSLQPYVAKDREWIDYGLAERLERVLVGKGEPPIAREEVFSLTGVNPVLTPASARVAERRQNPARPGLNATVEMAATGVAPFGMRDLPLLGEARGGGDEYFFGNGAEVLSLTYRPIELLTVKDAYAVYVHGTSMVPRFKPGELVYVDPVRPVAPGDDVVIQLQNGQGFVKELVRRTARAVICRQHNPPEELEYPSNEVNSVHLIVSMTRVRV